jgi:hypothetical protein
MNQRELEQLWVKGALPGVSYKFGDEVRIKVGERAGATGRIVALLATEPAPDYIFEFSDGTDGRAPESELEPAREEGR